MMQNKLSCTGAELEKDQCKGVEVRERDGKLTSQILSAQRDGGFSLLRRVFASAI